MKTRSQTKIQELVVPVLSVLPVYISETFNTNDRVEYTQSNYSRPIYEVNIDFDEASEAWRQNKKSIGNGSYKYICTHENIGKQIGKKCNKVCYKTNEYCYNHFIQVNKKQKV